MWNGIWESMPKLRILPEAKKYLRDIQAYISEKPESPRAAFNPLDEEN
jgi:hypothetical protein